MTVPLPEIAGHRVLRRLHRGARGEILLALDPGRDQLVALKVTQPGPEFEAEVAALDRGAGDHVVRLLDVLLERETACLILERLAPVGARDLLERQLAAGEAVTLLAPLARELRRLHDDGLAHAAVAAEHIGMRPDGTPVLLGFGAAQWFSAGLPEVGLERVPAVRADREGLRAVAGAVLSRVVGDRARAVERFAADLTAAPHEAVEGLLAEEIFDVAGARTIRIGRLTAAEADLAGAEADATREPTLEDAEHRVGETAGHPLGEVGGHPDPGEARPDWSELPAGLATDPRMWHDPVTAIVERSRGLRESAHSCRRRVSDALRSSPAVRGLADRWRRWTPARRRVALVVGVGGTALGIGLLLVPPGDSPAGASSDSGPVVGVPGSPAAGAAAGDGGDLVTGDDPLAATAVLLATRRECIRELSVLCLDGVDQLGSAALSDDLTSIAAAEAGEAIRLEAPGADDLVLGERMGGSALIHLPEGASPASVLVLDTPQGWRIRAYLGAPDAADAGG